MPPCLEHLFNWPSWNIHHQICTNFPLWRCARCNARGYLSGQRAQIFQVTCILLTHLLYLCLGMIACLWSLDMPHASIFSSRPLWSAWYGKLGLLGGSRSANSALPLIIYCIFRIYIDFSYQTRLPQNISLNMSRVSTQIPKTSLNMVCMLMINSYNWHIERWIYWCL